MIEWIVELLGEFILQIVWEMILEIGLHSFNAPLRKQSNRWLAAVGYLLFGAIAGGISLLILPNHLTPSGIFRLLNLLLTPIAIGLCMAAIGAWRAKRGETLLRIDRFFYGFLFALGMAAIRFQFAK